MLDTVHRDGERAGLPADIAVQTYRIVQEALTNVVKHAPSCTAAASFTRRPVERFVLSPRTVTTGVPLSGFPPSGGTSPPSGAPVGGRARGTMTAVVTGTWP